jgi:hypothetical protein
VSPLTVSVRQSRNAVCYACFIANGQDFQAINFYPQLVDITIGGAIRLTSPYRTQRYEKQDGWQADWMS